MTGKTVTAALALAGLLIGAVPAAAIDGRVELLHEHASETAVSVSRNEGGRGVTVVRGSSTFVRGEPAAAEPVAYIDGLRINVSRLEPTGNWFIDRSGGQLVIVHCYTRQSLLVGGGRRILCDARRL